MTHFFWEERPQGHYHVFSVDFDEEPRELDRYEGFFVLLKDGSFKDFNTGWAGEK